MWAKDSGFRVLFSPVSVRVQPENKWYLPPYLPIIYVSVCLSMHLGCWLTSLHETQSPQAGSQERKITSHLVPVSISVASDFCDKGILWKWNPSLWSWTHTAGSGVKQPQGRSRGREQLQAQVRPHTNQVSQLISNNVCPLVMVVASLLPSNSQETSCSPP